MGEMTRERERSLRRWWQKNDGMSKMLGEDDGAQTHARTFFLQHEKLQKLKCLTSAVAQKCHFLDPQQFLKYVNNSRDLKSNFFYINNDIIKNILYINEFFVNENEKN